MSHYVENVDKKLERVIIVKDSEKDIIKHNMVEGLKNAQEKIESDINVISESIIDYSDEEKMEEFKDILYELNHTLENARAGVIHAIRYL